MIVFLVIFGILGGATIGYLVYRKKSKDSKEATQLTITVEKIESKYDSIK